MIRGKRLLAVVPARGGSKRLPHKNILELHGKPLIGWTIEAALKSSFIDSVVVSTDDSEIASVSKDFGAEVPFIRPSIIANDEARTIDVVIHAIDQLQKQERGFDYVVLLQPTSPLRNSNHIDEAISQLTERNDDAVISVCEVEYHPLWSNKLPDDKSMNNFMDPRILNIRKQDLPRYYRLNGAIYVVCIPILRRECSFFPLHNSSAYIMSNESSIDIDTKNDFIRAEIEFASVLK